MKCRICNHKWKASPGHLLQKNKENCPECSKLKVAQARKKKIKCIETGKEYLGASNTDKIFGYKEGTIARLCRDNTKSADGYHFTYL